MKMVHLSLAALMLASLVSCRAMQNEESTPLGIAVAPVKDGVCKMHIVVSMGFPRRDPPRIEYGVTLWPQWIDEHFQVTEVGGGKVPLSKSNFSDVVSEAQAMNPEFYLAATLKPGKKYTVDYVPRLSEKVKERTEITVTDAGVPFARYSGKIVH